MCNRALSLAILIALSVFLNSRLAVVMGEIIQGSVKLVATVHVYQSAGQDWKPFHRKRTFGGSFNSAF